MKQITKRKTVGELSLKATSDLTKYDPLELAYALCDGIYEQFVECAQRHSSIFDMEEFCVVMVVASDPLIKGVRRHKYTAFPFLPKPRPQQTVLLYNKINQKFKRLWSIPDAKVMAVISEMTRVDPKWRNTKIWCDAFFNQTFFETIRKQHEIKMLSESEYLDLYREELIKAGCQESSSVVTEPFDFSKIQVNKIVDTKTAALEE